MRKGRDSEPSTKTVGAVSNGVAILRSLSRLHEPVGVAAIARDAGVSVSSCFNILRTLVNERLVVFDDAQKTYRVGMGVLEFSAGILGVYQADLIRPELERISTGRNCLVGLWHFTENGRIVLVDRFSAGKVVRVDMTVGARLPAFAGAVGRCYVAHRNVAEAELKREFAKIQWQAAPTIETYVAEIAEARAKGYAFDLGNLFIGIETVASIITDSRSDVRFGISGIAIAGQLSKTELQELAADIRDTSDWISETLFGVEPGARRIARRAAVNETARSPRRKAAERPHRTTE